MLLPSCYRPRKWWKEKTLKLQPQSFNPPQPKAARPLPILHRVLVLPKKALANLSDIRSRPWLFGSLLSRIKNKPFGGQPRQGCAQGKDYSRWWHQIDECYNLNVFYASSLKDFIVSWPDGPFFFWQQKKQNCRLAFFFIQVSSWA